MSRVAPPILGVAGWKNSGKTTLVERLIAEFVARGLRVASVKHAHHAFAIDDGPTDSARHRRAGAQQVAIVSGRRWAMVRELGEAAEPSLAEIIAKLDPCDLVVVEGYKGARMPKIEVRRSVAASQAPLAANDPDVFAIAADHAVAETHLRQFALDDIAALADFALAHLGVTRERRAP